MTELGDDIMKGLLVVGGIAFGILVVVFYMLMRITPGLGSDPLYYMGDAGELDV